MECEGTIYLVHLDKPLGNAKHQAAHYLGWTNGESVEARLEKHRKGRGARMLAYAARHGIGFRVVRTWPGGRSLERRLKRQKSHALLCPECKEERRLRQNENYRLRYARRQGRLFV